jgi:AraC-like DNA-binding protein
LVRRIFQDQGIEVRAISLGRATISFDENLESEESIAALLEAEGMELLMDKDKQLVEQIKNAIIDLVHHTTFNAMVRNSDYLVEKFGLSYQYISSVFSKNEGVTLEKFIIRHKIEKAKELILYDELSLSEIAYMMGYSSVQYLSTQFRNVTGVSVSEFKKNPDAYRVAIEDIT